MRSAAADVLYLGSAFFDERRTAAATAAGSIGVTRAVVGPRPRPGSAREERIGDAPNTAAAAAADAGRTAREERTGDAPDAAARDNCAANTGALTKVQGSPYAAGNGRWEWRSSRPASSPT